MNSRKMKLDLIGISLSIIILTILRVLLLIFLSDQQQTVLLSQLEYNPSISYIVTPILIIAGVLAVVYGWSLRRKFLKMDNSKNDVSLSHLIHIFLILFVPIFLFNIVSAFLDTSSLLLLVYIASYLNDSIQILFFGSLLGVLSYESLNGGLSKLFRVEKVESEYGLGLPILESQIKHFFNKFWSFGLFIILSFLFLSNIIVFLVYPLITPTSEIPLIFAIPNFSFQYNPETGFYQEYFSKLEIDVTLLVNWKLIQSLLNLLFIVVVFLIYYYPKKNTEKILSPVSSDLDGKKPLPETTIENVALNILSEDIAIDLYTPEGQIKSKQLTKLENFYDKIRNSNLTSVMNLAVFNIALALIIVYVLQLFIPLNTINQSYELVDLYYINLTQLYWAGFAEELSFRLLLFGLPLFIINGLIYLILKGISTFRNQPSIENNNVELRKFLRKYQENPLKYLVGGWQYFKLTDFILLIISSFFFGYVHYQFGSWKPWKIFQAGVGGLIFGYAYYRHGLHAAIFLHTVNDFVIGLMIVPNLGLILNGGFTFVLVIIFGFLYSIYLLFKGFKAIPNLFSFSKNKIHTEEDV